jgi:hypothetical protein
MKYGLIAAFVPFAVALACTSDPPPPRPDAAQMGAPANVDSAPADAATAAEVAVAGAATPDAGGTDLAVERPAPDAPAADLPTSDLAGRDTTERADTTPDLSPDSADAAAALCGAVPREMLCTTYCQGIATLCTGGNRQYDTADQCRAACDGPGSTWGCGTQGETSGNSLFCRLAHMVLAGVGAVAVECRSAGPASAACR